MKNHSISDFILFFKILIRNVKYAPLSYLGKMKRNDCVDDDVDGDGGNDQ